MIKFVVFLVVSSVFVFCVTVYFRLGGYKSPDITTAQADEMIVISKSHIGAYHKINDTITEVENWAAKNNLPCPRTFGEYIDNPQEKDEDRLRSEGGCILTAPLAADQIPADFHYRVLPARKAVLASFEGAPSIGPFKVYPAVEKYMSQNHLTSSGPVIEIYEIRSANEATTRYIFGIAD